MYFYVPFHFFKLFFNFLFVAKAAFCKSRAHRGTPREGKMSHLFFSNKTAFFHIFLHAISFSSLFQFYFRCKSSILQVWSAWGYPQRRKNISSFFLESNGIFACIFTCHFSFLKSFSILLPFQKQHFASIERIVVPQKEGKCHFSFFLIKRHFCMYFYVPVHFFKLFFNFPSVAKAAFCKSRAHRGTPKGGKMSLLSLSDKTAFLHVFLRAISFF